MTTTSAEIIATNTWTKELPDRHRIVATAQLVKLAGNERPYFSVTGEILNLRRKGDNQVERSGAIHDEILRHFPELRPMIACHLADDLGVPMHAIENGLYFLGLTRYPDARNLALFADLWRIGEDTARTI